MLAAWQTLQLFERRKGLRQKNNCLRRAGCSEGACRLQRGESPQLNPSLLIAWVGLGLLSPRGKPQALARALQREAAAAVASAATALSKEHNLQDKTRQDKTRQDKTRQDETRQDKQITSFQPSWLSRCSTPRQGQPSAIVSCLSENLATCNIYREVPGKFDQSRQIFSSTV